MSHDPKEMFTTNAITRESIAEDLNNLITDSCNQDSEEFAANDSRLTSEVCNAYAKFVGSLEFGNSNDEEALDEYQHELIEKLGVTIPQWVD